MTKTNDIDTVRAADILGLRYRDIITGYQGTATGCFHYLHGCTRVNLEVLDNDGKPTSHTFDFPALEEVTDTPRHKAAGDVPG